MVVPEKWGCAGNGRPQDINREQIGSVRLTYLQLGYCHVHGSRGSLR